MPQKAPTSPLKYLWKSLETLPTLQAVKEEWKTLLKDEFSSVEPLLTPCPDLATSFPRRGRSRMGLPLRVVQHGDDDFVAVCDETGERYILSRSDLIVYRVFIPRLFSVLAQAMGLSEATVTLAPDFPALVGIFQHGAGVGRPVFLDIPRCQKDVERTLQQLNAQQSQSFVLLTPTATLLSSKSTELLSVRRSLHVSLDSAIIIDGSNRWVLNSDVRGKLNSDSVSNVESVRGRSVLGQQTSQQIHGMEETLHNDNIVDPEFKMTTKEQAKPQFLIVADNPSWLFQGTTSVLNGRGAALYEIEDESRAKDLIELFQQEIPNCPFKLAVVHYRELSPIQIKQARKQLNLAYQAVFAWHFENPLIKDFKSNELHKYGVKLSELDHELKRLTREAAEFKLTEPKISAPVIKNPATSPPETGMTDSVYPPVSNSDADLDATELVLAPPAAPVILSLGKSGQLKINTETKEAYFSPEESCGLGAGYEYGCFVRLAQSRERPVSRSTLKTAVWKDDHTEDDAVEQVIKRLRRRLGNSNSSLIQRITIKWNTNAGGYVMTLPEK